MKQLVGISKFFVCFTLSLGCVISFFNLAKNYDNLITLLASTIVSMIAGVYIYYLIQTGLWSLKKKTYSANLILILGLLLHFIIIFSAIYYSIQFTKELILTTIPFALLGLIIGLYDLKEFYYSWKTKNKE